MPDANQPVQLGDYRQLFVDDHVIDAMDHVRRVVNPPRKHPANPLIKVDRPWESRFQVGGWASAVYDESDRLFKMWYAIYPRPQPSVMGYAFSKDGIHWEKPALGLIEHGGSKANNIVPGLMTLAMILSAHDPDPAQRFKGMAGRRGTFSPDGVHWDTLGSENISGPIVSDNVITFCYDPLTDQYAAAVKINTGRKPRARRAVWMSLSKDFMTWSVPRLVLEPDERDDELNRRRIAAKRDEVTYIDDPSCQLAQFYGMALFAYQGMYLGMLQVLDISGIQPVSGADPSSPNVGGGGEDGLIHVQLTSSRDLFHWQRVADRQVFLEPGTPSTWDAATVFTYCPPIVVGDELWIYYTSEGVSHASPWYSVSWDRLSRRREQGIEGDVAWYREEQNKTPNVYRIGTKGPTGGVGLARLRLDGWVSIDADRQGGTLTTKPLIFPEGKTRLVINAQALPGGSIAVAMLDDEGNALPGFAQADCYPLESDALRHIVVWDGHCDISKLAGKPIRLRFPLRHAKLFSFSITD